LIANISVYYINKTNVNDRIQLILDENIDKLDIHYKSLLIHQKLIADSFYQIIINKKGFLDLYNQFLNVSEKEQNILRNKLNNLLKSEYETMKNAGVLQFQFVLRNNESILRMHEPKEYGDNLSDIRNDFKYTNETKKIARGLVQGRVVHGFRNVYPIINKDGEHLGAFDISFASDNFQNELTEISKIHAHFLIHKNIFKSTNIEVENISNQYTQSSEHPEYAMSLTKTHNRKVCIIENKKKLEKLDGNVLEKMDKGNKFTIYVRNKELDIEVISFLPIKKFNSDKTIAWIVSYTKNKFIREILKTGQLINLFAFLIFNLLAFFIYQQIMAEMRIKKEHALLDDVINSSEDMIFVTDFKTVSFLNKKFKNYLAVDYISNIKDICTYFVDMHGYLHKGLLQKNETFNELIVRTSQEDRVVCLIDNSMNPRAFTISIAESSFTEGDYLVTLTDITKIKERELQISNKAFYDGLTGVYNRNKFDELIDKELKRDKRYKNKLSVAIVDIDHFKSFNDTYGHLIGDEVLIMIANYLNTNVRDTDVFARWGGEEFVILFPETTKENAKIVCEKLRLGISELEHSIAGSVTASFGITQYQDEDILSTLFKRSDDALYEAKKKGRNTVCIK